MPVRGKPTPPGLKQSGPRTTSNVYVVEVAKVVQQVAASDAAALASLQAQLAQAQTDLATAQAQNVADAATISTLQAQVTSLQSQVTSLQAQAATDAATITSLQGQVSTLTAQIAALAGRATYLYYANLVEVLDNLYVPPYFVDDIISLSYWWKTTNTIYYASLTIPTSGYP